MHVKHPNRSLRYSFLILMLYYSLAFVQMTWATFWINRRPVRFKKLDIPEECFILSLYTYKARHVLRDRWKC